MDDLPLKLDTFTKLYQNFNCNQVQWDTKSLPLMWSQPSYASFCESVTPQKLPKRKKLNTPTGQIVFLHAMAHIEYCAIDLALDAAYRFRAMPQAYYADWLKVADDEIRHFLMIQELLKELGSYYGALPVHHALFDAMVSTQTLIERMAIVPRYMEANGLDANPKFIEKLRTFAPTPMIEKIVETLELIQSEEIDHVSKGDHWFSYACQESNKPKAIYFEIIKKYYPKTFPRMHSVNIQARKEAGFDCSELKQITSAPCVED